MTLYSQRNSQWSSIKMGNTTSTLGKFGCLVTACGMAVNLDPAKTNELFTQNGVYSGDLVQWGKISAALPVKPVAVPVAWSQAKAEALVMQGKLLLCHVDFDGVITTPNDMHWVLLRGDRLDDPWTGLEYGWERYPIKKRYTVIEPVDIIAEVNTWVIQMFQGLGIDLNKPEGEVRGKVQEVIDGWKHYVDLEQKVAKLEKDLSFEAGQAAEFEKRLILSESTIIDLREALRDATDKITARDTEVNNLTQRIVALEKTIDPETKVTISREQYARLSDPEPLKRFGAGRLLVEALKRLVGR